MELTASDIVDDGSICDDELDENHVDTNIREYLRSQQAILNHFAKFMRKLHRIDPINYPQEGYDKMYFNNIESTRDIFGRFGNFIIDKVQIKKL